MKNRIWVFVFTLLFVSPTVLAGSLASLPNTFTSGSAALASEVNDNFEAVRVEVDDNAESIVNNQMPPGMVSYFARSNCPTGWLKADGSDISITDYPVLGGDLFDIFGQGQGANTAALPDLRGEFLRGWDDGSGEDAGRILGSWQDHELALHNHRISNNRNLLYAGGGGRSNDAPLGAFSLSGVYATTEETGGVETRPRNVALLVCIKL